MTRSVWSLIFGLVLAALAYTAGTFYVSGLDGQRRARYQDCMSDASTAGRDLPATWPLTGDSAIDADMAEMHRGTAVSNAQGDCSHMDVLWFESIARDKARLRLASMLIGFLGACPVAWYFLLRRIAELRAAIAGNPPGGSGSR